MIEKPLFRKASFGCLLLMLVLVIGCTGVQNKSVYAHQIFTEGLAYEALNNYSRSLELYREVVEEFSEQNRSMGGRAQIRIARIYKNNLNNPEDAITAYQTYIDKYEGESNHQEIMLELARLYEDQSRPGKAIEVYQAFLEKYQQSPYQNEVLLTLGDIHLKENEYNPAETYFWQYLEQASDSDDKVSVYAKLARVYEETNQHQKQLDVLKTIIENHQDSKHYEFSIFQTIRIYSSLNQGEQVRKWARRYTEEFPSGEYQSRVNVLMPGEDEDS